MRADEPAVFHEPWEARVFALAVALSDQGLFTWKEWSATLAAEIDRARAAGDPDIGETAYRHWVAALERLTAERGLTSSSGWRRVPSCLPSGAGSRPSRALTPLHRGDTMVLDERARHELYLRLEAALGTSAADTLMEHLPPVGWADVVTKSDLVVVRSDIDGLRRDMESFEERMNLRFDSLKFELLATFRGELHGAVSAQSKTLALTLVGAMLSTSGLAFAAARLAG